MNTLLSLFLLSCALAHGQSEVAARAFMVSGKYGTNTGAITNTGLVLLSTNLLVGGGTGNTNYVIDCSKANVFYLWPTANFKITATNATFGYRGWIYIVQDSTGSRTMLYDTVTIKTNANMALTTTANAIDRIDMHSGPRGTNVQMELKKDFK